MSSSFASRTVQRVALIAALALSGAVPSLAQAAATAGTDPNADASAAMRACVSLAAQQKRAEAAAEGSRAEALFRARVARAPRDVEAIVGLARVIAQCELPAADMIEQGELSAQGIELLEQALALDPTHWTARFVLASINLRSPAFLGRAPRAAAEFDRLLAQQGERTDNPGFARVFEYRGALHVRSGQPDSARMLWQKGARLFPADSVLVKLARTAGGAATPAPSAPPQAATLRAVRVVASATPPSVAPSTREIGRARILTAAGGTADVLQAIQLQPGATRAGDGSDIYTRGGDPAETATLVDGSRVPTLSRFEGLNGGMFGAIEPFVVRSLRYSSGGFSVRHGDALSGVVEIETDGRPRERQVRAGLSLVQASGTARVPLGARSGAWVSARASQTAALLATHGRQDEFIGAPRSEEAIASFVASPSPTSEIRATAIAGQDDARPVITAARYTGAFHGAGAARSLLLSSRWLAPSVPVTVRTSVSAGDRRSTWDFGVLSRDRREQSMRSRVDVEWTAGDDITLRTGADAGAFSRRDRGTAPTTMSVEPGAPSRALDDARSTAREAGAYSELQLTHADATLTLGTRADWLPGESHMTVDPRINVANRFGDWTARAALGVFHQGRWRASPVIPDAVTPSGLAGRASHVVAGITRESGSGTLQAEAYVKHYGDYARFGAGPEVVSARARGVDLLASRKQGGRMEGAIAYSLLSATMQLADRRVVHSPFDVTHSATATLTTTVDANWSVGQTLRYGTGVPHTSRVSNAEAASMAEPLGDRLPAYGRLDLRVMRYLRAQKFLMTSFVEMINVTNHRNVSGATWDPARQREVPVHSFFASRTVVAGAEFQFH